MKRIAALSLVAAMAATGASAQNATTEQPTVSTQLGLAGSAFAPGIVVVGLTVVAVAVAAADNASGT